MQKERMKRNFNVMNTETPKLSAPHASQGIENQTYSLGRSMKDPLGVSDQPKTEKLKL